MLTKEELDQINRFSKAELTADQVYTFSVRLCDNEVRRPGFTGRRWYGSPAP